MRYAFMGVIVATIVSFILVQASVDRNAFTKSCPSNKGTTRSYINYDLTQDSALEEWTTMGGVVFAGPDGAELTIHKQGDAPTIVTDFYIFYGEVSVEMKASTGTGIVSAVYMLSDDNDKIDWEALGGFNDKLQTDYFGKGDNTEDYNRWTWQPVTTPQEVFHNYTSVWSKEKLSWAIDGTVVRTVDYADAKGGSRYPQTPMRVRIGIWAGGDTSRVKGTIDWAGGETDYSKAPFTMYVRSVEIVNYNPAKSYIYSDHSGSSDSVEIQQALALSEISISLMPGTSAEFVTLPSFTISTTFTKSVDSVATITSLSSTFQAERPSFSSATSSIESEISGSTNYLPAWLISTKFSSSSTESITDLLIPTGILRTNSSVESSITALNSNPISTASAVSKPSSTFTSHASTVALPSITPNSGGIVASLPIVLACVQIGREVIWRGVLYRRR